jgi:hypothetical protein
MLASTSSTRFICESGWYLFDVAADAKALRFGSCYSPSRRG